MIILSCLLLAVLFQPVLINAGPALETVRTQMDKALNVLRDPVLTEGLNREAKESMILPIINEIFDYMELSKMTLGRDWKKMTPEQRREFVEVFSRLLHVIYMDKIMAYTDEEIVYIKENALSENKVEVHSEIITNAQKIPISYHYCQIQYSLFHIGGKILDLEYMTSLIHQT